MLKGARLLVATSLGVLAAGCTYAPAPDFGTLQPTGLDDYYLNQYDIEAVRRMVPQGPPFNDQLRVGYLELADMRRIILPLLRPAILAALVYSFVRAMTAISAVVFLVSAQYEMATTYILGRVENGEYGVAVAYASVLILVMLVVIGIFQLLVGERRLGRRRAGPVAAPVGAAS